MIVNRRGFSLMELIVAMGIFAILAGLSLSNFGGAQKRAKAQGMADILVEEMRATRRRAMAKGYPVAMVFPTDGGSTPCTRSFYILEGREKGELFRSKSLGNELADAFVFVGSYNGSETIGDPPTGDVADTFDPVAWLPAGFSDNALIFTPTGRVRSSGLPVFNSSFHVLTALAIDLSGTTANSVTEPYTVTISPVGEVSVQKGAEGIANSGSGGLPTIASAAPAAAPGNSGPAISQLRIRPGSNSDIYNPDIYGVSESYAQLYPDWTNNDGMTDFAPITVELSATDPDGDQLFCRFRANPDRGDFSLKGDADGWAPMSWNPTKNQWEATTTYLIPADTVQGDYFDIEADISDGDTVIQSTSLGTFNRSLRRSSGLGKIAFDKRLYNDAAGDWNDAVYAMNLDGTGVYKVTDVFGVNENNPDWSPDGAYLTFSSTTNGDVNNADVYISTADGRYIYNLSDSPGVDEQFPIYSPDGNRVAYLKDGNADGRYALQVQNVRRTSAKRTLAHGITSKFPASWNPTGDYLCYVRDVGGGESLVIQLVGEATPQYRRINFEDPGASGTPGTLEDANGFRWDIKEAQWCPSDKNGNGEIIFRADRNGDGLYGLYLVAVNPVDPTDASSLPIYVPDTDVNPPVELLPEDQDVISCAWAPGGNKIAAACQPNAAGEYRVKILYMNHSAWPPTIDSVDSLHWGKDSYRPRFTSNGNILIVQSAKDVGLSYKLFRIPLWSGATPEFQLLTHKSKDVISHSNSR